MNLSSKTTYLLPSILLLIACWLTIYVNIGMHFYTYGMNKYFIMVIRSSALAFLLYFGFKKAIELLTDYKYVKYSLIVIPVLVTSLIAQNVHFHSSVTLYFLSFVAGLFLYLSFYSFSNRYTGYLTEETIEYKNLLGQTGVINLKDIVKLEQKRNILAVLSRLFRFLDISRRTETTFHDESFHEYSIEIFTKTYQGNAMFSEIIKRANKAGNGRIRQYTV